MRMFKRFVLLSLGLALLLLSSCASAGVSAVLPTAYVENTPEVNETVRVLHIWPEQDALFEEILGKAAKENGFAVSVSSVKFGTSLTTLRAAHAADAMYDLFAYRFEDFYTLKSEGLLYDLSDSINALNADFYPNAIKQYTENDALYGIPYTAGGQVILYNRDYFESYGWKLPEDQDSFVQLMKDILSSGFTPLSLSGKPNGNQLNNLLSALTENRLSEDDLLDDPLYLTGRFTDWGGKLAMSAVTVKRWSGSGFFGDSELALDDDASISAFLSGQSAMLYIDLSDLNLLSSAEHFGDFAIGAFLLPPCEKGQEQLFSGSGFHTAIGVWSETEYTEETAALLSALNKKDNLTAFANASCSLMAAKGIAYEGDLLPLLSPYLEAAGSHPVRPDFYMKNVSDLSAQLFVDYLTSDMTADDLEQNFSTIRRTAFEQSDRSK